MWWMRKAMVRCKKQLDQWNSGVGTDASLRPIVMASPTSEYFMVMQVHDELVFDFPKAGHPKGDPERSNLWRVRILQKLMEKGGDDFGIPTPVSVEYHPDNWSEGVTC